MLDADEVQDAASAALAFGYDAKGGAGMTILKRFAAEGVLTRKNNKMTLLFSGQNGHCGRFGLLSALGAQHTFC